MTDPLKVGRVYTELPPLERMTSTYYEAVKARAWEIWRGSFDYDTQRSGQALLSVLAWHTPWRHWEQVFRPTYVGDRFLGGGCRSCGPGMYPCLTVRAIGDALHISPDH